MKLKDLFNKSENEIVVFTAKGCSHCDILKEELKKHGLKYTEKDTAKYQKEWVKLINLTNMPVTPAVIYKNTNFFPSRDFPSAGRLVSVLKTFNGIEHDFEELLYERIKTFNHHVNMGFSRLDRRLIDIENLLKPKESKSKTNKSKKKK